ncbi:MAG: DUF378 domain-containing protein [Firmicutes bacterium]|nr:DUF378 domain-containing protein [Bacillota bacterium]
MDRVSLLLVILGAINWGLIALFQFDLVAYLFGGSAATVSRIIYGIVGLAGLWCISLLFRDRDRDEVSDRDS